MASSNDIISSLRKTNQNVQNKYNTTLTAGTDINSVINNISNKQREKKKNDKKNEWISSLNADTMTSGQFLGSICYIAETDPIKASSLYSSYLSLQNDPNSRFYNAYSSATNQAVGRLQSYGIDVSNMDDKWYNDMMTVYAPYLVYGENSTTPKDPGKKATTEQNIAYDFWNVYKSKETTEKAQQEWKDLQYDLSYWAQRTDRNYSDEEILNEKIDWSKFKTLKSMDDSTAMNRVELNTGIGYSQDAVKGVLWAARNGGGTGDLYLNIGYSYLGEGKQWEYDPEIAKKLDPNSAEFHPYSLGSTNIDDAALYFGVSAFTKDWVQQHKNLAFSKDETEREMYLKVQSAYDNQVNAETELDQLLEFIQKKAQWLRDPDDILNKIDWNKYPTLKKMDQSIGQHGYDATGTLVELTEGLKYRYADLESYVHSLCDYNNLKTANEVFYSMVTQWHGVFEKMQSAQADTEAAEKEQTVTHPTVRPTEQQIEVAKSYDKKIAEDAELTEPVNTPAEQAANKNQSSTLYSYIKNALGQVRNVATQAVSELYGSTVKGNISSYSGTILSEFDTVSDYERNSQWISELEDTEAALREKLGDLINNANAGVAEFDEDAFAETGRIEDQPSWKYLSEESKEKLLEYQEIYNPDDLENIYNVYLQKDASSVSGLTEEEQADYNEYKKTIENLEYARQKQVDGQEAYDQAKKKIDTTQQVQDDTIAMMKDAGLDTKAMEDAAVVTDFFLNFTKYDPTKWGQYNFYHQYSQMLISGASNADEMYQVAETGDQEIMEAIDVAKTMLEYADDKGMSVPDNVRENIQRYIESLERQHEDFEYLSNIKNDDFKGKSGEGHSIAEGADKYYFDWGDWGENASLETQPGWGMLSKAQQEELLNRYNPDLENGYAGEDINSIAEAFNGMMDQMDVGARMFGTYHLSDLLTDYETETYYYLLASKGREAAEQYVDHLTDASYGVLNSRAAEKTKGYAEGLAEKGFFGRRAADILSVILSPVAAIGSAIYSADVGLRRLRGERVEFNPDNVNLSANIYRKEARAKINEEIIKTYGEGTVLQKVMSGLQEIISNRADSMANALVFGPLFSGISNEIAQEFFSAMPMALTAATDAVAEAKENGIGGDMELLAIFASTLIAEAGTEAISIDNMKQAFKDAKSLTHEGLSGFMKNWLTKSGISEMVGETFTEIWEQQWNKAIGGENSDYEQAVRKYLEENKDMSELEARELAGIDMMNQVLHTALISYLSPGADIVSYAAGRYAAYRQEAKYRQQNTEENVSVLDVYREYKQAKQNQQNQQNNMEEEASAQDAGTAVPENAPETQAPEQAPKQETAVSEEERFAQDMTVDFEILESSKTADNASRTASIASVLDTAQTAESADVANAAAANMDGLFGENTDPSEGLQDLIVGAYTNGVSPDDVKQAVRTAALSKDSAAYQMMQSEEYQNANIGERAEMLATTVNMDMNNATVTDQIAKAVHENRVALAEQQTVNTFEVQAKHDAAYKAQGDLLAAQEETRRAQDEFDNRQDAVDQARKNLTTISAELPNNPTDDNLKQHQAAIAELRSTSEVAQEYKQKLENAKAAEQKAQETADRAIEDVANTKRELAEKMVAEEDQQRAAAKTQAEAEAQAQAEVEAKQQAEQEMTDNANTADVESFIDEYRRMNPNVSDEQIQHIRERFEKKFGETQNADVYSQPVMDESGNVNEKAKKIVAQINKKFSVPIVFSQDTTNNGQQVYSEGYYNPNTHQIIVDGNLSLEEALTRVIPHELLHSLEKSKTYTNVVNSLLGIIYGEGSDYDQAIDNLNKNNGKATTQLEQDIKTIKEKYERQTGKKFDYTYAAQEIAATRMGEMFYDPSNPERSQDLINRLVADKPNAAKQIMNAIKSIIKQAVGMRGAWLTNAQKTVELFESALSKNSDSHPTQETPNYTVKNNGRNSSVKFDGKASTEASEALRNLGLVPYNDKNGNQIWRVNKSGQIVTAAAIEYALKNATTQDNKYSLGMLKKVSDALREKLQYIADQSPFAKEYKAWNKTKDSTSLLTIGKPSSLLISYGVPDADIKISGGKIIDIQNKHPAMTDNVIRQIPSILEKPVMIMESQTRGNDTITMFGELVDKNGYPVLAALAITPTLDEKTGVEFTILRSAYGKDRSLQNFIDKSNILYTDETRADSWAATMGLQLPSGHTQIDSSDGMVPQVETDVNRTITDSQGNDVATDLPGGTVALDNDFKFSLNSFTKDEQARTRQALLDLKDENGKPRFTPKEVDKYLDDAMSIASMIAQDRQRLDFEASDNQVFLKPNNDYHYTLDASTLCAKRLLYQGTFDYVQHALPDEVFTPEDLIDLVNIMNEMGYETPCGICYVESRRRWLDTYAQKFLDELPTDADGFIDKYFKKAKSEDKAAIREWFNGEKPSIDDLTTSDGLEALRQSSPYMYKAFVDEMNHKGTANPKVVQLRTEYRGDISKMSDKDIQKVKDIGGLRIQSFSDFETPHLLDMIQAVMDMSARKLTSQAYTKVPNFAWVFGDTGIKINLSLIGKGTGLDADGNLVFDNREGMDFDEAMKLRDRYNQNVGTILVGINDDHIIAAMGDPRIDFIIPFHKSGWSQEELRKMPTLNNYNDYTNSQNELMIVGEKKHKVKEIKHLGEKALDNWIVKEGDDHPGYKIIEEGNGKYTVSYDTGYETESFKKHKERTGESLSNFEPVGANWYWDFDKSGEENSRVYLQKCADEGRIPKFSQFLVDNGDGTFSLPEGTDKRSTAIREGYWKTLIDFKMYENDGYGRTAEDGTKTRVKGAKQREVTPDINMNEAYRVMNEYQLGRQMPDKENGQKGAFISMKSNNDTPVAIPAAERYIDLIRQKRQGNKPVNPDDTLEASPTISATSGESFFGQGPSEEANMNAATAFGATEAPAVMGNTEGTAEETQSQPKTMAVDAETGETVRYSLPSDAPYLSAVDHGNMEEAQEMVDEKAKENGYDVEYAVWRGDSEPYNELEPGVNGGNLGTGLYFTPNKAYAERFATKNSPVRKFYLKTDNTFNYNDFAQEFNDYAMSWLEENDMESRMNVDEYTWSQIWDDFISENDYDSVKATGVGGISYGADEIAVQNSWQAKLADPVTYDDNGNVIPLSERFNDQKDDIRFSLPSDDLLDQQIDEYLKGGGILSQQQQARTTPENPNNGYRQWGNNLAQQSDELDQQAKDYVLNSEYAKDTNAAELDRALAWVRSNKQYADDDGYQESLQKVTSKRFNYRTKDGQARMIAVMGLAVARNDVAAQVALADAYNQQGTDLGQALQSRKLFRLMTPQGRIATLRKMLGNVQDQLDSKGIRKEIKLSDWIYQAASEATEEGEFTKIQQAAAIELADQIPANWKDKMRSLRMLSMLGNPRTHIRNIIGNALFVPAVSLKNKMGALVETISGQEERTKTLSLKVSKEISDFAKQDAEFMKDELTGEAKYNEGNMVQREQKAFKGFMQAVMDFNSNALEAEDWFFLKGHYKRALSGWIDANGYTIEQLKSNTDLLNKGREYAISEAQKATYRDFNGLAAKLNQLSRNPQTTGQKILGFATDAVLPFKKTPANILKRGIEYSPAGLVRGLKNAMVDVRSGKITAAQAIDRICSGLSGTAVMALGYFLSNAGIVTCGMGDDEDKFGKEQGNQKYSIKLSLFGQDVTFTMDWAAPMSMPFFVGAAICDQVSKEGDFDVNMVMDALGNIAEPVLNLSMLDGVNTLFKTSQHDDTDTMTQIAAKVATNYVSSYVPSLLGAIARTVDDKRRASYVKSGEGTGITGTVRYALEQAENKIPGLSQTNIPVRDVFGNAETSGLAERILENFILPGYISNYKNDPVLNEMDRLYNANVTDSEDMVPKDPAKSIKYNNEQYRLSAEEWDLYKTKRGQTAYDLLSRMINTSDYKNADEATQAQMIKQCWDYADNVGKQAVLPDYQMETTEGNVLDSIKRQGKITSYNAKMMSSLESGDFMGYETMLQALLDEGVEESTIKNKISKKYINKYKEAYRKHDQSTMSKIEEILDNTGFTFDVEKWENDVEEKYGDTGSSRPEGRYIASNGMSDVSMGGGGKNKDTTGQYGEGNIDLNNRQVVQNDDGSISTEQSFSFYDEQTGKEVLIPTVINGKIVSEDEAIDHYYETGEYLGMFDTPEEADRYAEMLHNRQDWYYHR